jgi:hypothetical protein
LASDREIVSDRLTHRLWSRMSHTTMVVTAKIMITVSRTGCRLSASSQMVGVTNT